MTFVLDHQVAYLGCSTLRGRLRADIGRHRVIRRELETVYFDAESLPLYHAGAMLRTRGRVGGRSQKTDAKFRTEAGVERYSGDYAKTAAARLVDGATLRPVATQIKHRLLLLVPGTRRSFAPDFVVALDQAVVRTDRGSEERDEIELQIFTALPWTAKVDAARVNRFSDFCHDLEDQFGLTKSPSTGYQAISQELLT